MLEWIFASIEFRNPNLLERINRRVGGCNGERCHGTSRRRSEVVGQGLAIDLGLEGKNDGGASVSKVTEVYDHLVTVSPVFTTGDRSPPLPDGTPGDGSLRAPLGSGQDFSKYEKKS